MRGRLGLTFALLLLLPLAGCLGDGKKASDVHLDVPPTCDDPCLADEPAPPVPAPIWPHFPSDGLSEATSLEIPSFDSHVIPITVFKPKVASATQQVPVLLSSHGFTGSRYTDPANENIKAWVAAGFGVVAFDVGSSRVDLQACKLEYSIVSPK